MKICVLNPYIPTMGGGEKHMGYFIEFLEKYYKDAEIDIIVHNYNDIDVYSENYVTIDDLNNKFGINLKHTRLLKIDLDSSGTRLSKIKNVLKIEGITRGYDIFINNMFLSKHIGKAKKNLYLCMFPPKTFASEKRMNSLVSSFMDWKFSNSYDYFIPNSEFTNYWLNTYWKNVAQKSRVIYPPVFSVDEIEGRYQEDKKENLIISVGRFFSADHCKRQLDMVKFFINNHEKLKGFEYHLVGTVSTFPQDLEYFNEVKRLADSVDNIMIHEDCSYEELMDLYTRAKIFWHATGYKVDESKNPEKMEHFGITTVEAMSFGAVPVVINKGGQKETVVNGENGFLWDTEKECIESTLKLAEDEALRIKFSNASVERAKRFSIDEFYEQNRRMMDELSV